MPKLNIYIVEDEPLISRVLKQTVMCLGHNVCGTATSYPGAIAGLRQADADLIITDIMLEGDKTGVDLAHYINTHLKVPFLFQSSVIDPVIIGEALKTSPVAFIPKPLDRKQLAEAVAKVILTGHISPKHCPLFVHGQ